MISGSPPDLGCVGLPTIAKRHPTPQSATMDNLALFEGKLASQPRATGYRLCFLGSLLRSITQDEYPESTRYAEPHYDYQPHDHSASRFG